MRCLDQDPPRGWTGVHPPRTRGDQPEQVDVQLAITGLAALLGYRDQLREARDVAKRSRADHLLDPRDPGPLERAQGEPLDVAQQRSDDLRSPELKGQPGRTEQAAAAACSSAQFPGPSQCGYRLADRAAFPRSASRLLELQGD